MRTFTIDEKILCIERELNFRKTVYQRRVDKNAMSKSQADYEIGCMESILQDYKEQEPNLFNQEKIKK